ncbi:DUF6844 domain-containing protein [Helicobacter sp.]|uniref:DUF6844 domain-containing protein n=1 Tax=Helicobacter sp. TaxID=218 RepID=UPI00198F4577|nr:hypothetical protein [Helicobacter sp.]MBD5165398.1 hypothetical protein [Helicobacter sp.]
MKKILFGSLLVAGILWAQGSQPAKISQEDIKIQNELSDASLKDITPKSLEEFFEEFEEAHNITYGQTKNGKTFYTGEANVSVSDTDPQFAQSLQLAFEKAMLNLQKEFIKDAFGRISTEKIATYEHDQSSNAREFEELPKGGTISQVFDKLTQLAGAKLDAALRDLGVDATGLSEERKKILLKDEFMSKSITQAFGSMSGLIPIQTIVTHKRGEYKIGVIAVISDKTRQLARDMSLGRQSLIKGKGGKAIKDYLPKENAGFVNEYGIRLVYDENGAPVILSYGNWGFVADAGNAKKTNRLEDAAKETALTKADSAIIEFINTNISLKDEQTTGETYKQEIKETLNKTDNTKDLSETDITNTVDKVSRRIKATASGKIRGIRTIKQWSYTAENGVEHVGVVRAYSYANLENTNQMLKTPTQQPSNNATTKSSETKVQRQSNIVNDLDDF